MSRSVVGCDGLPDSGYLYAKVVQADLTENSVVPYSLVYSTEVFEYIPGIADSATEGGAVWIAPVRFQPLAIDDLVRVMARRAVGSPLNGRVEVAGPEQYGMDELFRTALAARNDPREVITDKHARYFGTELSEQSLVPVGEAILGEVSYRELLADHERPSTLLLAGLCRLPLRISLTEQRLTASNVRASGYAARPGAASRR
jgi:uncharacterized protein YbjT (DUF2867 family)